MAVTLTPILAQALQGELHHPASQIGHVERGQDEKAAVVDHQTETALLLLDRPTNPLFAQLEIESAGGPGEQPNPLPAPFSNMPQVASDQARVLQVMLGGDDLIKALGFVGLDGADPDALQQGLLLGRKIGA